jgi:hypothetical protein
MSEITKRIQEKIIGPAGQARRDSSLIATVTKTDEKNNVCSILFIDKDGYKSNRDNVSVKIYNSGIIDWFPVVGELVHIKDDGIGVVIESKCEAAYRTNVRPRIELKKDILPTSFGYTMGGTIF